MVEVEHRIIMEVAGSSHPNPSTDAGLSASKPTEIDTYPADLLKVFCIHWRRFHKFLRQLPFSYCFYSLEVYEYRQ